MAFKRTVRRAIASMAGFSLAGTVLAGGCGSDTLEAVAEGLNMAAQSLNGSQDDYLAFGEWLLNELGDL